MDKYDKLLGISAFGVLLWIVFFIFTGVCGIVTVASLIVGVSFIANVFLALVKAGAGLLVLIFVSIIILLAIATIMRLVEK